LRHCAPDDAGIDEISSSELSPNGESGRGARRLIRALLAVGSICEGGSCGTGGGSIGGCVGSGGIGVGCGDEGGSGCGGSGAGGLSGGGSEGCGALKTDEPISVFSNSGVMDDCFACASLSGSLKPITP